MSNLDKTPLRFVLQCTAALGLFATAGAYFFAGVEVAGGVLVCLVQTAVFCILSSVYVALAVEQHEAHEDHAHPAH